MNFNKAFKYLYNKDKKLLLVTLFSSFIDSVIPYITYIGLSLLISIVHIGKSEQVAWLFLAILFFEFVTRILSSVGNFSFQYNKKKYDEKMRSSMYINILNLSYEAFVKNNKERKIETAENAYRYSGGYGPLVDCLKVLFQSWFGIFFGVLILVIKCFNLNIISNKTFFYTYCLSLVALFTLELIFEILICNKINEKIKNNYNEIMVKENKMSYFLYKVFNDYTKGKSIRLNRMSDLIMKKYNTLFKSTIPENLKMIFLNSKIQFAPDTVAAVINGIVCIITVYFVSLGFFDISYIILMVGSIFGINNAVPLIIREQKNMTRYLKQQETYQYFEDELKNNCSVQDKKEKLGKLESICFENVSFKYENSSDYVLRNINFKLDISGIHTIVGRNGSGKTTLIKLMLGLLNPTEGKILINGKDINSIDMEEFQKLFSVVFQDFNLYAYSIAENISCSENADVEKIENILQGTELETFIKKLPDGLNTQMSSYNRNGIELSGGEKQKIAIVRGKYKNGSLWVMDEPTAALDPVSEESIFKDLYVSLKDTPCIYISHRLSSCIYSDEVIVMENGTINSIGSHNELLKTSSVYKSLWDEQLSLLQDR